MVPTRWWRLKSTLATLLAGLVSAWDYNPGLVPKSVVRIIDLGTDAVVYESEWKYAATAAEREAASIQAELDTLDVDAFAERYGIDLERDRS